MDQERTHGIRRFLLGLIALGMLLGLAVLVRTLLPGKVPTAVRLNGAAFGTTWQVRATGGIKDGPELQRAIEDELVRLNEIFSTYAPDSELMRFNRHEAVTPFPCGDDLRTVLVVARQVWSASGGAFDPTVGPLVRRWGFGRDGQQAHGPDATELTALRARVGFGLLDLTGAGLAKTVAGIELDLAAIAKGYAVDQVSRLLSDRGLRDHYVEIGGEVCCRGTNTQGEPWMIGIQEPRVGSPPQPRDLVPIHNRSIATSGAYRNFYDLDGRRISHTINPRTGSPIGHDLVSVSVIAPTCVEADAWATALNVLGPEEGRDLAVRLDLAALFMREQDGVITEWATPAFRLLVAGSHD